MFRVGRRDIKTARYVEDMEQATAKRGTAVGIKLHRESVDTTCYCIGNNSVDPLLRGH